MEDKGERFEKLITRVYSELSTRIDRTATQLRNEKAPGKKPVPQHEQLQQYLQLRQDPAAWQQIVGEQGVKNAIKYYQTMEGRAKREFDRLNSEYGGMGQYRNMPIPQAIIDGVLQIAQTMTGGENGAPPQNPAAGQQPPAPAPAPGAPTPDSGTQLPPGGPNGGPV